MTIMRYFYDEKVYDYETRRYIKYYPENNNFIFLNKKR